MSQIKRIFISAGESSSDTLGAALIAEIKRKNPEVEIAIIGGKKMESHGYESLFAQEEIAIMGYFEIIGKIFKIRKLIRKTKDFVLKWQPDVFIAIDSRGFNSRVIKHCKKYLNNTKYFNYVSPSIWAYRYKRIYDIKALFDHQFTLYPFEKKYYDEVSMPCTFIGHPLGYEECFKNNAKANQMAILPGSRVQEIKTMLPIFLDAAKLLCKATSKNYNICIITLPHLVGLIKSFTDGITNIDIITEEQDVTNSIRDSALILTKSGTVSLELMRYNTPMVVAHKINALTAFFIRRLLKVKYISIGNLIANKEIIPELLQENCNSKAIMEKLITIADTNPQYDKYLKLLQNEMGVMPEEIAYNVITGEPFLTRIMDKRSINY